MFAISYFQVFIECIKEKKQDHKWLFTWPIKGLVSAMLIEAVCEALEALPSQM